MTIARPMLAATVESGQLEKIEWPAVCSPKIDGIRCIIHPRLGPVTRSFKPIPNHYIRNYLEDHLGDFALDGELVVVDEVGGTVDFNSIQSAVMSHGGEPRFQYWVFDMFEEPHETFVQRLQRLDEWFSSYADMVPWLKIVRQDMVESVDAFVEFAAECLGEGYEGAMLRHPSGPYKSGRSTLKQGWLLKYKEWKDAEGRVVGYGPLRTNTNPDEKDMFGLAKRSHMKDGLVELETLGYLILDTEWGRLSVGSGFDQALRKHLWDNQLDLLGRLVTFKYQDYGMKGLPRFPIFKGFRDQRDT